MPVQPGADLGMLVGGIVVEDDVDGLVGGQLGFDRVQEAHELLMAVALHVAADTEPSRTLSAANRVVVPWRL